VTPFDNIRTNDFLDVTGIYNISAIIIITENSIDTAGTYDEPKIITFSTIEDGLVLMRFQRQQAFLEHKYYTDVQ
jgi:hypothetical protein